MLPRRFQKAIDDAAMVAGKKTANEYVGEWRRTASAMPAGEEVSTAAEAVARTLDAEFPRERLAKFVANGGFDPESGESQA